MAVIYPNIVLVAFVEVRRLWRNANTLVTGREQGSSLLASHQLTNVNHLVS